MGKLQVVVGGQFGSEGKGALAAWLARREWKPLFAVRVAGPNAGHTAYDDDGIEFKLQQIPVAAVLKQLTPGQISLGIAAGSEIDMAILTKEANLLKEAGHSTAGRLFIDNQATILEESHMIAERGAVAVGTGTVGSTFSGSTAVLPLAHGEGGLTKRIGSTGKGVGAARAARIMREAKTWGHSGALGFNINSMVRGSLGRGNTVQIEGTQGWGLGLHAGYYPYCTSSDCRAIDFMSMVGVSPWAEYVDQTEVWVTLRTYPIRVAGDSGPLFGETTWDFIGQSPEFTTVTKKVRRVGAFDPIDAKRAIADNGGFRVKIALMFGDYIEPNIANQYTPLLRRQHPWIVQFERDIEHKISVVGTGPRTIVEVQD